ncbi:ABC transporter substrate-binding protein [Robbsia sp. KACC 23696]|uniref:ABC transporter substrate-binding protein n=1 Tax=Robbsia sp. KACC 23696 TaxID=3149231 RepID=UPI00325B4168
MSTQHDSDTDASVSPFMISPERRRLLKASAAVLAAPLIITGQRAFAQQSKPLKKVTIAWSATAVCTVPVPVALKQGIFAQNGLDVSFINFAGSTDQLLEAIASQRADAGVGMALRWLKPLEQGFDVKILSGLHSGCIRLLASKTGGVDTLAQLKGKTIGVSDMASPSKNFFSILLKKQGIDPENDVQWRAYPSDLLGHAITNGEVHAVADNDPVIWLVKKNYDLKEIASNMTGEYANRSCCVLAVAGNVVRKDRPTAVALSRSIQQASEWVANNQRGAAEIFASYAPKVPVDDLVAMLQSMNHHHHPHSDMLEMEIRDYANDLKLIGVMNASTDADKFAKRVYADVLA